MKFIVINLIFLASLFSADASKKWESNRNCEACHWQISKNWKKSRHANSHFSKNQLFKKTLEFMVKESPFFEIHELQVECAKCHNPAISKTSLSDSDKMLLMMDLDFVNKEYDTILNSKRVQNGINCLICHNIKKIHLNKKIGSQGVKKIEFGQKGLMFGPFDDAFSPYHSTKQNPLFTKDDGKLCFACHYSGKNVHGLEIYATGKEFEELYKDKSKKVQGCKSCHMSKKKTAVASNYAKLGEKAKERKVREHIFASVDNSDILEKYIKVSHMIKSNNLSIFIHNTTPHYFPSGYGLREVELKVNFFNNYNRAILKEEKKIGARWVDRLGEITVPNLAISKSFDNRLKGRSSKEFNFGIPTKTAYIVYSLSFKMIGNDMARKIGLTDDFFTKEYKFLVQRINF